MVIDEPYITRRLLVEEAQFTAENSDKETALRDISTRLNYGTLCPRYVQCCSIANFSASFTMQSQLTDNVEISVETPESFTNELDSVDLVFKVKNKH